MPLVGIYFSFAAGNVPSTGAEYCRRPPALDCMAAGLIRRVRAEEVGLGAIEGDNQNQLALRRSSSVSEELSILKIVPVL